MTENKNAVSIVTY